MLMGLWSVDPIWLALISTAFAAAFAALGLSLQWGSARLLNFGPSGLVALGGVAAALLWRWLPAGSSALPAVAVLPIALVAVAAGGFVAGFTAYGVLWPALRWRREFFSFLTFAFGEGVYAVVQRWPVEMEVALVTGGNRNVSFLFLLLAVVSVLLVLAVAAVGRLENSPWGRVLRTVRADPVLAAASGKDVTRFRGQALVIGAVLMGVAGAIAFLSAHYGADAGIDGHGRLNGLIVSGFLWAIVIAAGRRGPKVTAVAAVVAALAGAAAFLD